MNAVSGAQNQPQSLLHSYTNSADQKSGAGFTNPSEQDVSSQTTSSDNPPQVDSDNTIITTNDTVSTTVTDTQHGRSEAAGGAGENNQAQEKSGEGQVEGRVALNTIKEEGEVLPDHVNGQIELLEHNPEAVVSSTDGVASEEGHEWVQDSDHELKRVKVYELIGSRWVDQGTAFCFGQFQEETSEALLIARSEKNYSEIILSTAIRSHDVYQRQQDTLIVWTEPDGVDYALSFQDPEGCSEVWNFILEVQRHMNSQDDQVNITSSPLLGPEASVTTASIIRSGHLPQPQLGIIGEIERAIKTFVRTQLVKERICEYIQQDDYIKSLIEVMNTAEELESLENLHALCSIMQTILMLNDHSMYEHILDDELFFGVVGMLEYDPDFPGHKANYREFLRQTSHFHQPIPIREPTIQRKIHHTYRLLFLKDVVLARALDDSTFNVLNSCIIFNQIDIINHVQQDPTFLRDVVRLFVDEDMLSGGGNTANKKIPPMQGLQTPHGQIVQPQHMVISLNGNGDNMPSPKIDLPSLDSDPKLPSSSPQSLPQQLQGAVSPKPLNGTLPPQNGRQSKHGGSYAFAPPDDLSEADIDLRREVIVLIQQLCVMGKNVQLPARMALFRTLVDRGILFAVQWALGLPEREVANKPMFSAAGEVLSALLDHDLNGVRGHVLKQVVAIEKEREAGKKGADKAETILEMACRIMAQSKDLAMQSQMGDALKTWMDIPTGDGPVGIGEAHVGPPKAPIRKDDPGTERYMDYFYKDCIHILLKPLSELTEWKNVKDPMYPLTREETNRFVYLCDLLYNFITQHNFRSHFYVMSSNIVSRVATLLKAKDKHLRHAAFRNFRLLLKQNNVNMHAQIMKHDVIKPILDLTLQESRRDNLLSCSCQEYFDSMRRENMKEMIRFCMTKHEGEIRKLAETPLGSQRFELFMRRWEMNNEPMLEETKPEKPLIDPRGWPGQGRIPDVEEEDYFNADDDEDDLIPPISHQWSRGSSASSPMLINTTFKQKRRAGVGSATKGYRPPLRSPVLGSLVDYDEDEDSSGPSGQQQPLQPLSPSIPSKPSPTPSPEIPPSSPKLAHRQLSVPPMSSGPPPRRATQEDEDEEDSMLEALVRPRARSQSPAPSMFSIGSTRSAEKRRRRDDDEDDEMLVRLSKSKKPDLGSQKEGGGTAPSGGKSKNGDDPPKKIKVKFNAIGLGMAKSSPSPNALSSPSETGAKDGDTG